MPASYVRKTFDRRMPRVACLRQRRGGRPAGTGRIHMTSVSVDPPCGTRLAVETAAVDELRATVRVTGVLSVASCPLLTSVLRGHLRAGRRYLRADLTGCRIVGSGVLAELRAAAAEVAGSGGMLVFSDADEPTAGVLRPAELFVSPAA